MQANENAACVCGRDARVFARTRVCREHARIELIALGFPPSEPGQFLQVQCLAAQPPDGQTLAWPGGGFPSLSDVSAWGQRQPFLRRPFSIADQWCDDNGQTHIVLISRNVGPGTAWLDQLAAGDSLNITGPLGHGFEIPQNAVPIVLVGGGVGIPPLLFLSRRLFELGHSDVTVVFGATSRDLLPVQLVAAPATDGGPLHCAELPGNAPFPAIITTDDGSLGLHGLVTGGLRRWHQSGDGRSMREAVVFACGPERMLNAVGALTRELGICCQLSVERNMGCGLGTCLSCVVRVRDPRAPSGWRWALSCSEGPVFDRDQLC